MSIPLLQIKVYDYTDSDALLYTIDDVAQAKIKFVVTDSVGTFDFTVRSIGDTVAESSYTDIGLHDKVELYLGYDTLPATPTMTGRIGTVTGTSTPSLMRTYSGQDVGEILKRRLIRCERWDSDTAHTIADAIADSLGMTKNTDSEITTEIITVENETYMDLLKRISDYYYSTMHSCKKDFYITESAGSLVLNWKTRPIRPANTTEQLIAEVNIKTWEVIKDVSTVKNKITVMGGFDSKGTTKTPDDESWTETAPPTVPPYWTALIGAISSSVTHDVGSYSVRCDSAVSTYDTASFKRTPQPQFKYVCGNKGTSDNSFSGIHFHANTSDALSNAILRVLAPDTSNYFYKTFTAGLGAWNANTFTFNDGSWTTVGTVADWDNITGFWFFTNKVAVGAYAILIDDLCLVGGRYWSEAEDATVPTSSQSLYGIREMVHTDKNLITATQCAAKAQTLRYQYKDPPTQLNLSLIGNTNVKVGDRCYVTIPAENISTTTYTSGFDVINVEHVFTKEPLGFGTNAILTDGANKRFALPRDLFGLWKVYKKTLDAKQRGITLLNYHE